MNVRNFIMYDIQQLYCGDHDEPISKRLYVSQKTTTWRWIKPHNKVHKKQCLQLSQKI